MQVNANGKRKLTQDERVGREND